SSARAARCCGAWLMPYGRETSRGWFSVSRGGKCRRVEKHNRSRRPGTHPEPSRLRVTTRCRRKAKEPVVFYGAPRRAGDRGRTGDVQLGNPFTGPEDEDG